MFVECEVFLMLVVIVPAVTILHKMTQAVFCFEELINLYPTVSFHIVKENSLKMYMHHSVITTCPALQNCSHYRINARF